MDYKNKFLKLVDENIKKHGYQITNVNGSQVPNFSYTIGLYEKFGFELIKAGSYISNEDNEKIFNSIISGLNLNQDVKSIFKTINGSNFKLVEVHKTWKDLMILGAFSYYNNYNIKAFQITPSDIILLDTPIMFKKRDREDPIWFWLDRDWNEKLPLSSYVITDEYFLIGEEIIELMRWKDGFWEMFTRPASDVLDKEIRILPISTMIAIDESLKVSINLSNGNGLLRDNKDSEWKLWE